MMHVFTSLLPDSLQIRLQKQDDLRQIIVNTGWLFADRILRMGIGLIVGIWVARYLGPAQYGLLSYATAFIALFGAVATLGLDTITVRELVRSPLAESEILGTSLLLRLISGIIVVIAAIVTVKILEPNNSLTHWLIGITATGMIFQAFDTIDYLFQAQVKSKFTVYAKNAAFILIALVRIILIKAHSPLIAFVWAGLFETILGAVGLILIYQTTGKRFQTWRYNLTRARSLLSDSWPLILSSIMIMIYMRIDQVMLGRMVSNEEVGIYSSAVRFAEVWYFIPMAIVSSVYPKIVQTREVSEALFYARLQKLYNLMALLAYLVAIPATFLSYPLIHGLLGEEYSRAAPMLTILIWAGMFTNLGVARSSFLTSMNWTKVHFFTVAAGCVINVVLNLYLIPLYGGMGAVIASCVAYWFATYGACFVYRPLFRTGWMLTKAMFYPKVW